MVTFLIIRTFRPRWQDPGGYTISGRGSSVAISFRFVVIDRALPNDGARRDQTEDLGCSAAHSDSVRSFQRTGLRPEEPPKGFGRVRLHKEWNGADVLQNSRFFAIFCVG